MTYVTVAVSRLHNQYSYPPVRPSVHPSRPPALSPCVASSGCAPVLFSLRMHRSYTRLIMYSVRDFVFDKYKSTMVQRAAHRATHRTAHPSHLLDNIFREIPKTYCATASPRSYERIVSILAISIHPIKFARLFGWKIISLVSFYVYNITYYAIHARRQKIYYRINRKASGT